MLNGALNGTAGYATDTLYTKNLAQTPLGVSLADGPVLTPVLYDPLAPKGQRWSNPGYSASTIPRMYHSGALLLPDTSIFVAGSNPNPDFDGQTKYKTEYRAEKFFPHYYKSDRPAISGISGIPTKLSYGGDYFNITLSKEAYTGDANEAAGNTTVVIIRSGFTTHAMNMAQRMMQLNNTYTVNDDGSIVLHVRNFRLIRIYSLLDRCSFMSLIRGLPSNGKYVLVGSGAMGAQSTSPNAELPVSAISKKAASGAGGSGPASGSDLRDFRRRFIIAYRCCWCWSAHRARYHPRRLHQEEETCPERRQVHCS